MKINKKTSLHHLIEFPQKPFQEFEFRQRNNETRSYDASFSANERAILDVLLQIKNVDIATNGFAIMFCKDKDVSSFFQANEFNSFWLDDEKNNSNNEKIFYLDSESVRRIASTKAFKTMQSYALTKGKTATSQSCMFFDVDGSGKLVLRGAVSVNYLATKSKAHVFVSTKLCKNFEMGKNEEKVTFNF